MTKTCSTRRKVTAKPSPVPHPAVAALALAHRLDRLADFELQNGHHALAEHLAHQAAEMREVAA